MNICHLDKSEHIKNSSRDLKILKNLLEIFKTTNVGVIKIYNKKYIIKKEYFAKNYLVLGIIYKLIDFNVDEYKFYSKFENKIKKYHFNKNIQLPIKYKICKKFNVYLFKKIDYNLNNNFIKHLNITDFNNILGQATYIMYFLNHTLKIFHNDIALLNKLHNFMVNKNDKKYFLSLDKTRLEVGKYSVVIIDFGLFGKKMEFKEAFFYYKKNLEHLYIFEIHSELLIVVYTLLNIYYKKKINFKKLYLYIYEKIHKKTLKIFDKYIFNNILSIDYNVFI